MKGMQRIGSLLVMVVALLLAACGGGAQLASGGTGGTGAVAVVSRGPITQTTTAALGATSVVQPASITVNGVTYNVGSTTTVSSNGTVPALRVGMVVTVSGSRKSDGTGQADSIAYSRSLTGAVGTVGTGTFTVYGETVVTDNLTSFEGCSGSLATGQWVEVSGFVGTGGTVRATYVECAANEGDEVELQGVVTEVSGSVVTVGGTTQFDISGLSGTAPQVGDYVEVVAHVPADPAATTLYATQLEIVSTDLGGSDDQEAEVSGFITEASATAGFIVAGQHVVVDTGTRYVGGLVTDLVPGVLVSVEGKLSGGDLVADQIEFSDAYELVSKIDTVAGDGSFTLQGLAGITIAVDATLTDVDAGASLTSGSGVKVRARLTADNTLLATRIEADDVSETELQAPLQDVGSGNFTVLNTIIDTSGLSYTLGDLDVTRADFFSGVAAGTLVEVYGQLNGDGTITWQSLESN